MSWTPAYVIRRWFDSQDGLRDRLIPRWLFLRALGLIYFSAFYALIFQIRGLIGADGILPASEYLDAVARQFGCSRLWFAPTLLWLTSSNHMLTAICWAGMIAALLLVAERLAARDAAGLFRLLPFVRRRRPGFLRLSVGRHVAGSRIYLAVLRAAGICARLGRSSPPSRASLFLLQWEWFRIYFESGVVKLASGDPEWRNFTAMDEYYQNGPLPTWIGWYVQHLPHWFHAFTTGATLVLELGLVFMLFLPRRWRIVCFFIVTLWQIPVILTANYTFLNYLVLLLGVLLLDDRFCLRVLSASWRARLGLTQVDEQPSRVEQRAPESLAALNLSSPQPPSNVNETQPDPAQATTAQRAGKRIRDAGRRAADRPRIGHAG